MSSTPQKPLESKCPRAEYPGGSKCPNIEVLGSKDFTHNGFGVLIPS